MINYFWNNYKFLSNFYPCRVIMDGLEYNSTEHAYQAAKTLDSKYRATIAALPGDKAAKAKRMGSEKGMKKAGLELRPAWEEVKKDIMLDLLRQKFRGDEGLGKQLLLTHSHELIEGNAWHDNYWGSCLCSNCKGFDGQNWLGILLMQVRQELMGD
ncbi:NADAR family protein [Candidatus Pacearchaeota archaeon]|nr:NADAR family protein [Candidatus Pacearchaeota archaeon]